MYSGTNPLIGAQLLPLSLHPSIVDMPWLYIIPVAFLGSVLFTALMIRFGARRGWVVVPRQDRWSQRTVTQFGGIPILLAFVTGALWFGSSPFVSLVVLLTVCAGILGLVDDLRGLTPLTKLVVEGSLASAVILSGSLLPVTSHWWMNAALTLFWIVGITNAVNLMDNMDGLAAGVAQVSLLATIVHRRSRQRLRDRRRLRRRVHHEVS